MDKAWWDALKAKMTPAGEKAPTDEAIIRDMATVFNWVVDETLYNDRKIVSTTQDERDETRLAVSSLEKLKATKPTPQVLR